MKKALLLFVSFSLLLVIVACNNDEGQTGIDSGTSDEEYEGVVNPKLDVIYKLSDEEIKNGIAPLEMDLEIFIEESESNDNEEDGEMENEGSAKPKI
ncbi:hypothetical protein RJD24_07355 [Bacillaceae bacterium IKA-2]|nr:hypothetical protein RJD24_07355 [Bacillaceae bacterium IKA-2]